MSFDIKIELLNVTSPTVWRRIKVNKDISFHKLHLYIQAAFGWRNSHLYQFSENGFSSKIRIASPHDEEAAFDGTEVTIERIFFTMYNEYHSVKEKAKGLKYIYDYGDGWEHDISVIGFDRDGGSKAQLINGQGACPPEDCGGVHGFEEVKKSLKTGEPSQIHGESWVTWLEGCGYPNYDPNDFNIEEMSKQMRRII